MDSKVIATKLNILGQARRGYHHGNLKEVLIEAARVLIAQKGPTGFTLAEAAKLAGVTAAAPYRHFTDRNALLLELARRGFGQFADCLETAWDKGQPDPLTAFLNTGPAYLSFVKDEPGLYSAMFSSFATVGALGMCNEAARARRILFQSTDAAVRQLGGDESQTHLIAVQIWSLSHGVATLGMSGYLNSPNEVLSAGMRQILEGGVRQARKD